MSPVTVTGATNGTLYTCQVTAHNAVGDSPAAKKTVTPSTTPGAPTSVTATAQSASALFAWAPPAGNGGAAVTAYVVRCVSGLSVRTANVSASVSSYTMTALANGTTYQCTVAAKNLAGTGPPSDPVAVTPSP